MKNERRGTITTAVCIKHLHTHTCTYSTSNSLIDSSETPKALEFFPSLNPWSSVTTTGFFFFHLPAGKPKPETFVKANRSRMFSPVLKPRQLIWLSHPWLAVCACLPRLFFCDMNIVQKQNKKPSGLEPLNSGLIYNDSDEMIDHSQWDQAKT